jgi:dihydrofolate reductase
MEPLANLSIIAALSDNRVIGRDNRLPWRMPADLAHFKRLTMGKPIIMGRRTWESLPGLLPHRTHVIVTRDCDYAVEGGLVVH